MSEQKKALVYGMEGALANAVAGAFATSGWKVQRVSRTELTPPELQDAYIFPQGQFVKRPFVETDNADLDELFNVGLITVAKRLRYCLSIPAPLDRRVDYVLIGSTSAYQGFANTAAYCAAKHGLLGLCRALNDEYKESNRRFWLFSMGTMDTPMGRQLADQDPTTFLSADDVAQRIVSTVSDGSNLFEPEVVIRRRTVA